MIDREELLHDAQAVTSDLVDDLRVRSEEDDETRVRVRGVFEQASSAERTDKSFAEWREDLLAQVAVGWVLSSVFVRFCEDNGLFDTPLLSGPGPAKELARDHMADFFAEHPTAGDREWLVEVFGRYADVPGIGPILGEHNPMWQIAPSADGARAILDLWWATTEDGTELRHDFTDPDWDTRFLGDLYQDLSEHAQDYYALKQTPEFVESFILDRAFEPAVEMFGIEGFRMIDPTCGSGHFLLGGFDRLTERWRAKEPATNPRALAQRALDSVAGVDLNPFATAVARFRLLVAALSVAETRRLHDAPDFRINVATGDSLLHGSRPETLISGSAEFSGRGALHHYPTEDAELADVLLQADGYDLVVGNPPYINPPDPALNTAYRQVYASCHRQYQMTAPFIERFWQLARRDALGQAGFVGAIVGNAFMTRQFGTKLVSDFLPTVELLEVIDTSGAYIPGHGTPTVILVGRSQRPTSQDVRAVLGIRGEPGTPPVPAEGEVWTAIRTQVDHVGTESDFVSVDDVPRLKFNDHPWSLQGGSAGRVKELVEQDRPVLEGQVGALGYTGQTNADPVFLASAESLRRRGVEPEVVRNLVIGQHIRDWAVDLSTSVVFPYRFNPNGLVEIRRFPGLLRWMWPNRSTLWGRRTFSKQSYKEEGRPWWEWHQVALDRVPTPSIMFAFVATHNHFVLDRGGKVFKQSAPMMKLAEGASEEEHLGLLGLLNSSTACFWMKQVFHNKGEGGGARVDAGYSAMGAEEWRNTYEFDSTKLKQFPVPAQRPLELSRRLDEAAQELAGVSPSAVADELPPSRDGLTASRSKARSLRAQMVALQEELDWEVYGAYDLLNEDLTADPDSVPALAKGERAFEIVLARSLAAGKETSTYFERHDSTPITDLPAHWSDEYREVVQRRIELIESDRSVRLLERPEHKRRWYWDALDDLEDDAQETWLADRVESYLKDDGPDVITVAALADRLATDHDARQVAQDLAGTGADLVKLVGRLVERDGVPYLAAMRLKESGLRTRRVWEETWRLQRKEDELDARTALPADHAEHLPPDELEVARKEAGVDDIPVPPKYKAADWRSASAKRLRGKLDVPKERFITYPGTRVGADPSMVVGWAGWDHLEQARVLAAHFTTRKQDGAEPDELTPLLAGVGELVPWVVQWHNDPDPVYGERMGDYLDAFVATEVAGLGLTRQDLTAWRP